MKSATTFAVVITSYNYRDYVLEAIHSVRALSMRSARAREALDLSESLRRVWRLSAENCLVFGCSVLGAHKYYLPTGCVCYRINERNGSRSNGSPRIEYLNKMTSSALINHDANKMGVASGCIEFRKREFMTKPHQPPRKVRRDARLFMMRHVSSWRKRPRALNSYWHAWRGSS